MAAIADDQTAATEIVLTERITTNSYKVLEIHESVQNRFVRVEIELGPFFTETITPGNTITRGSGRRGITVWENADYDAVRDTWRNEDLLARLATLL